MILVPLVLVITKVLRAPGLTVIEGLILAVIAPLLASVAVTVCVPTVFSVTLKVCVPDERLALAGSAALPSVDVIAIELAGAEDTTFQ